MILTPNHYPVNRKGLVGWWSYRNSGRISEANTWMDKSGNSNDGTLTGNTYINSNGANFDGNGDYIDCGNVLGFDRDESFSFAFWIKTSNTTDYPTILAKRNYSTNIGYTVYFRQSTGYLGIVLRNDNEILEVHGDDNIADGYWHFCAVSYDGSSSPSGIVMYVDNSLQSLTTLNNNLSSTIINSDTFKLATWGDPPTQFLNGDIDNIQVYNFVLASGQIEALYNAGRTGNIPSIINRTNLLLWQSYTFSGLPGIIKDYSGNGNNGTCNGDVYVNNQGTNFDGSGDYVNCGNDSSLQITQNITLACWIKCSPQANKGIITKYTWPSPGSYSLQTADSGSGVRFIIYDGSSQTAFNTTGGVQDNAWHYVAATYDKSYMRIYIDGDLDSSNAATHDINNSSNNLNIGARTDGGADLFIGKIDDVMIFNRALSAGEIKANYLKNKRN